MFTKSPEIDVQLLVKMQQTQGHTQTLEGLKFIRGSWLGVNLAALHRPLYKVSFFFEGGLKGALAFWLKPPAPSGYVITFFEILPLTYGPGPAAPGPYAPGLYQDHMVLDH